MTRSSRRLAAAALFPLLSAVFLHAAEARLPDDLAALLSRIFAKKEFKAKTFGPAKWLDEGKAYTTVEDSAATPGGKDIVRYETSTGARRVLVPAASLVSAPGAKPFEIDDYDWSKDGARLLIFTNTKKIWRKNTRGDYWVLEVRGGKLRKLGGSLPESSLMFAKFSPDGKRVAYVHANNIYVQELGDWLISRLTADGSGTIINGTADWVYEEEFDLRDGFRWSPDGRSIAFWRFDASGVGMFSLINNTDTLYPVVTQIPYPKAGTTNSAVKIGVVDAAGGPARYLDLPGDPRNTYVPRMEWVDATGEIIVQQLNRLQNSNDVWLADAKSGQVRRMLHDEDKAWVDVVDSWQWLPGGRDLLWVSEKDGWTHAWAAPHNGGAMRLLTPGNFDILSVDGVNEKNGLLYFIASPDDATRRYLYRARLDGKGSPERVTPAGTPGKHSYVVSPDGQFALHTHSTLDRPPVIDLIRLPSHQTLRVLEDNKAVAAAAAALMQPATEFFRVDIGG